MNLADKALILILPSILLEDRIQFLLQNWPA